MDINNSFSHQNSFYKTFLCFFEFLSFSLALKNPNRATKGGALDSTENAIVNKKNA